MPGLWPSWVQISDLTAHFHLSERFTARLDICQKSWANSDGRSKLPFFALQICKTWCQFTTGHNEVTFSQVLISRQVGFLEQPVVAEQFSSLKMWNSSSCLCSATGHSRWLLTLNTKIFECEGIECKREGSMTFKGHMCLLRIQVPYSTWMTPSLHIPFPAEVIFLPGL